MTTRCREGHDSTEDDYCSVCGAQMPSTGGAPAAPAARGAAASSSASVCPSCGEPRGGDDARFCEVCRHDFLSGQPGKAPRPASVPAPTPPARASVPGAASAAARWQLVIMVDPTLDLEPDPTTPCPKDRPNETVGLDRDELLVGRHDDLRDIRPDIALHDPGASRRHAKFVRSADGGIALQDLASTNGTRLNGTDVVAGSRTVLKDGDEVAIGRWTRIKLRGAP
jgi:hypothetical protein